MWSCQECRLRFYPAAPPPSAAREGEALRLLRAVRDADVIFAKSEWPLSQEIAAILAALEQQS